MEALVTMQSIQFPDVQHVILTEGETFKEVCIEAFLSRNNASSWDIVDVEVDGIEIRDDLLPISGRYYVVTGRVT